MGGSSDKGHEFFFGVSVIVTALASEGHNEKVRIKEVELSLQTDGRTGPFFAEGGKPSKQGAQMQLAALSTGILNSALSFSDAGVMPLKECLDYVSKIVSDGAGINFSIEYNDLSADPDKNS